MSGVYVDTSALGRVLLDNDDAAAILRCMSEYRQLWSSELLAVELRRLGARTRLHDHLDAALTLSEEREIAAVLTFDRQLGVGCRHHGLDVELPLAA